MINEKLNAYVFFLFLMGIITLIALLITFIIYRYDVYRSDKEKKLKYKQLLKKYGHYIKKRLK